MQTYLGSRATRARIHKYKLSQLDHHLKSPILGYVAWTTVAILVLYRLLMGEWHVLAVCGISGAVVALLQQQWHQVPVKWRGKLQFSLGALLAWGFLTMHAPAHALFFDTLESGLTTLLGRFGVSQVNEIPQWVGGVFRLVGIVGLAVIALRFGRDREGDEEATKGHVGRVVQIIAGLLVFDVIIELFVG